MSRASAHFSSLPAVPISFRPSAFAHWQAIRPTPPAAACQTMKSPGSSASCARTRLSRYCVVRPFSIIAAPVSNEIASGSLTTVFAGITRATA